MSTDREYKKYSSLIEKHLESFESTVNEWHDFINFIQKLKQILAAHSNIKIVPKKLIIAKRLAQSMNPALPSGVHTKALEVYQLIFDIIGPSQLAEDLPLYSYGLFPFLQHANTSNKPALLDIYSRFYLPLNNKLKPCLKGLILALLPAIEEEANEFFEPVLSMLDKLSKSVGEGYFFHCIWLCLISAPHLRIAALNYLLKRLPKVTIENSDNVTKTGEEDIAVVLGDDTSLLSQALSSTLADKNVLVQRATLELLLVHFPLNFKFFGKLDLLSLVTNSLTVVLRKDMSLNRRLYSWLGSNSGSAMPSHIQDILVSAAKEMFSDVKSAEIVDLVKPYKIMISLLDKAAIGQLLLDNLFIYILLDLESKVESLEGSPVKFELLQTANMFFRMIDPFLMWQHFFLMIKNSIADNPNELKPYKLLKFAFDYLKLDDEETLCVHLPSVLCFIIRKNNSSFENTTTTLLYLKELCHHLINLVPDMYLTQEWLVTRKNKLVAIHGSPISTSHTSMNYYADFPENTGISNITYLDSLVDEYIENIQVFYDMTAVVVLAPEEVTSPASPGTLHISIDNDDGEHCSFKVGYHMTRNILYLCQVFIEKYGNQMTSGDKSADFASILEYDCAIICRLSKFLDPLHRKNGDCELDGFSDEKKWDEFCNERQWIFALMESCQIANNFYLLNTCLSTIVELFSTVAFPANLPIQLLDFGEAAIKSIWKFLSPNSLAFHHRCVQLIWLLCSIIPSYVVENIITKLVSGKSTEVVNSGNSMENIRFSSSGFFEEGFTPFGSNFDRFGVFWRLSAEEVFSDGGIVFSRPLFIIFDTMTSLNPHIKRTGEAWFKTYLTSYVQILDPLLSILTNADIIFQKVVIPFTTTRVFDFLSTELDELANYPSSIPSTAKQFTIDIHANVIVSHNGFNCRQVLYVFETLNAFINASDGELFLKNLWFGGFVENRKDVLGWVYEDYKYPLENLTYTEFLVFICLRYLTSKLKPSLMRQRDIRLDNLLNQVHSNAISLLNSLILSSKPQYGLCLSLLNVVQDEIIRRLFYSIHISNIDLQPELLLVLRNVMMVISEGAFINQNIKRESISSPGDPIFRFNEVAYNSNVVKPDGSGDDLVSPQEKDIDELPLFVRLIVEALSNTGNRAVLHQWIDFMIYSASQFKSSGLLILPPLIRCVLYQVSTHSRFINLLIFPHCANHPADIEQDNFIGDNNCVEVDVNFLLFALEKLVSLSLSLQNEEASIGSESVIKYLADITNSVFVGGDESTGDPAAGTKIKLSTLNMLPKIILVLFQLYSGVLSREKNPVSDVVSRLSTSSNLQKDPALHKQIHASNNLFNKRYVSAGLELLSTRINRRISKFLQMVYALFPGDMIESVFEVWLSKSNDTSTPSLLNMFELVPECTSKIVIVSLVDPLRAKANEIKSRVFNYRSKQLSEASLLICLDTYAAKFASENYILETWPNIHACIKEYCLQYTNMKMLFPPLLRAVTSIFDRLSNTSFYDNKRFKKDAEDAYLKLCDFCILICGRSFEQGIWRRNNVHAVTEDLIESPPKQRESTVNVNEATPKKRGNKLSEERLILETTKYLGQVSLPNIRKYIFDQDRIVTLFANAVYYVVVPGLKTRNKLHFTAILELLKVISSMPFAIKTWKKEAGDAFYEYKFFQMESSHFPIWEEIIHNLISNDKDRITDIITRVSAVPSSSFLSSKEQEILSRSIWVRRLSFIIFAAPVDYYLPQLPLILGKLVDILKGPTGQMHIEAYLCLRVLIFRISTQHLSNLWPIVLADLIRLFATYLKDAHLIAQQEDLNLFFAACKFLDLLLVLNIEEFQCQEWMFISDTFEVIHELNFNSKPVALIDKLSLKWDTGHEEDSNKLQSHQPELEKCYNNQDKKRPLITSKTIQDKKELELFVKRVSQRIYQSTVSLVLPDKEFIEELLEKELIEN